MSITRKDLLYLKARKRARLLLAALLFVPVLSGYSGLAVAQTNHLCIDQTLTDDVNQLQAYVVGVANSADATRLTQEMNLTIRVYPSYSALESAAGAGEVLIWKCREPLPEALVEQFPQRIFLSYDSQQEWVEGDSYFTDSAQLTLRAEEVRLLESVGAIQIGLPRDSAPISMRDSQGAAIGLDADIAQLISERIGVGFEWLNCGSWPDCIEALEAKEIDALSFMTPTTERQRFTSFTVPYWLVPWAIASSQLNPLRAQSYDDLTGTRLAVVENYSVVEELREVEGLELVFVESPAQGLNLVLDGRVDSYMDSLPLLVQRAQEQQTGTMVLSVLSEEAGDSVSIGLRDDLAAIVPILDRAILSITEQERSTVRERWFSATYAEGDTGGRIIPVLSALSAIVLLAALFVLLRNWRLRRELKKRRVSEELMKHMAMHDSLTSLPNRNKLEQVLEQHIESHHISGDKFAVLFLDLDGFKVINDDQGHELGDEILKQVASRLRGAIRQSDLVARQGGDEFVVVLSHIHDAKQAVDVGYKLIDKLDEPFEFNGYQAKLGVSVGVALYPDHGTDKEDLVRAADDAMYSVKSAGKHDVLIAPHQSPSESNDSNS